MFSSPDSPLPSYSLSTLRPLRAQVQAASGSSVHFGANSRSNGKKKDRFQLGTSSNGHRGKALKTRKFKAVTLAAMGIGLIALGLGSKLVGAATLFGAPVGIALGIYLDLIGGAMLTQDAQRAWKEPLIPPSRRPLEALEKYDHVYPEMKRELEMTNTIASTIAKDLQDQPEAAKPILEVIDIRRQVLESGIDCLSNGNKSIGIENRPLLSRKDPTKLLINRRGKNSLESLFDSKFPEKHEGALGPVDPFLRKPIQWIKSLLYKHTNRATVQEFQWMLDERYLQELQENPKWMHAEDYLRTNYPLWNRLHQRTDYFQDRYSDFIDL